MTRTPARVAWLLALCGLASANAARTLRPEMLVHWPEAGSVACASQDLLLEFMGHAQREEQTKALAMLGARRPCQIIPTTGTGKIVAMAMLSNGVEVIEVIAAGSGQTNGLWTPSVGAVPGIAP